MFISLKIIEGLLKQPALLDSNYYNKEVFIFQSIKFSRNKLLCQFWIQSFLGKKKMKACLILISILIHLYPLKTSLKS